MIDVRTLVSLQEEIKNTVGLDAAVLEKLRKDVRPLKSATHRIQPRTTTAISLVGTDGGNNKIHFDPFMVQVIRVVDSSENEYCLEIVTPTFNREILNNRHFNADGSAKTSLGKMMSFLGVSTLDQLSPMIPRPDKEPKPSWVQVYRELMEWAILFELVREKDFATDTVIVRDGFLRSKVFAQHHATHTPLFKRYREGLEEGIARQFEKNRRRIYLVGIAKHSKVLQTYRLAMALEGVLRNTYASFVEIPRQLEENVYQWAEYARGDEQTVTGGEANKFVAGKMFFVKFGGRPHDPIWAIDILQSQADQAGIIFGYLLADALNGFPVPFYPQCLQRAHEHAALVDLDMDILQDEILKALRSMLGDKGMVIDELSLEDSDPSAQRYGQ